VIILFIKIKNTTLFNLIMQLKII